MAATPPVPRTSTRFIDAAHLTLQPLLLNAISVFALAYIIRRLGPTAFGQWAVGTTLNAAVMFLVGMGLRPLFVRSVISEAQRAPELLAEQLGLRIALGLFAAGIATATAVAVGYPTVIVLSTLLSGVSTIFIGAWTTFADYLQAFQRVRVSATITTLAGLVLTAISVVVAAAGGGAIALAACYISGPLLSTVGLGYVVRTLGSPVRVNWNASASKRLLKESRPLAFQQFLHSFRERGEQLLVPKIVGIQAFGFFAAGMMPVDRLEAIPDSLNTSYFTSIASSYGERGAAERAIPEVRQLLVISLIACLAAALAMASLAPLVARILFRGGGSSAELVMSVTIWSLPLTALAGSMMCVLQATGHHRAAAKAGIMSTLVGSGTSLTLIALVGLTGAIWGVVVRQAIAVTVFAVTFSRLFGSLRRIVPFGRIALACVPSAIFLWFVSVRLANADVGLILGTFVLLALFGVSLCVLRILPWPPPRLLTFWKRGLQSAL